MLKIDYFSMPLCLSKFDLANKKPFDFAYLSLLSFHMDS